MVNVLHSYLRILPELLLGLLKVFEASKARVRRDAAHPAPLVDERDDQAQAQLPGDVQSVIQCLETYNGQATAQNSVMEQGSASVSESCVPRRKARSG